MAVKSGLQAGQALIGAVSVPTTSPCSSQRALGPSAPWLLLPLPLPECKRSPALSSSCCCKPAFNRQDPTDASRPRLQGRLRRRQQVWLQTALSMRPATGRLHSCHFWPLLRRIFSSELRENHQRTPPPPNSILTRRRNRAPLRSDTASPGEKRGSLGVRELS